MSETKINGALVSAYLASEVMPKDNTAFEGAPFVSKGRDCWAELIDIPTDREPAAFGGANPTERTGYLQVNVYRNPSTIGGPATGALLADADKALTFYHPGRTLEYQGQKVRIRKAERSRIRTDDGWLSIAIFIYYTAWIFPA